MQTNEGCIMHARSADGSGSRAQLHRCVQPTPNFIRFHVPTSYGATERLTRLTCNYLVAYVSAMDDVFKALADASRRSLLDRLHARGGQTLNELCDGLAMTRQAVTKHLAILEQANLVSSLRHGREKLHYLNPVPIHRIVERWIKKFERAKLVALGELKRKLEE